MPAKLKLIGERFSRLVVIRENPIRASNGKVRWDCLCDCGNNTTVDGTTLKFGLTKSCGCYNEEQRVVRGTTHGKSKTKLHRIWCGIKDRCYNKNSKAYPDYGGRGIQMSDEFRGNFDAFAQEVGEQPDEEHTSIDRIDTNLGYIKGNLRWATRHQQSRNRRKFVSNTSGHTGVYFHAGYKSSGYWCASYYNLDGIQKSKCFNIDVLGEDVAMKMAVEYRNECFCKLQEAGAGYSADHGQ